MDSPQSVVSPFKGPAACDGESAIGVLDVFIHQARDIQNICIYHKQDVYAKISLTTDLHTAVSTKIINGGGINPVFNDNLKLNVRTVQSSLKCEVWMLSRVKNYLEDQLLGFALIPLSEIILQNGNMLEKEFCLSSTDLFHSPSGFIRLSLAYSGTSPELIVSLPTPQPVNHSQILKETELLDKIEFPDPKVVNENQMMVSEYYGYDLEPETQPPTDDNEDDKQIVGVNLVESFSKGSDCNGESESESDSKEKNNGGEEDVGSNVSPVKIKNVVVPESKVVQQDIVDMYMKSMQQFTESLAKMKLPPVDVEIGSSSDSSKIRVAVAPKDLSDSGKMGTTPKTGAKVFYGSRAFF